MQQEEMLDALKAVPLLSEMSKFELVAVLDAAEEERFKAGQDIVTQGDVGGSLFLLVEGSADVHVDGSKVRHIAAGGYFGEMALIDSKPRSATIRAVEDSRVIAIPSWSFLNLLEGSWPLTRKIMANLSARIRGLDDEAHG